MCFRLTIAFLLALTTFFCFVSQNKALANEILNGSRKMYDDSNVTSINANKNQTANVQKIVVKQSLKQTGKISKIAFTPNGQLLAVAASGDEKALKLFNKETGQLKTTLAGSVEDFAFCFDSRTVAISTSNDKVNIWDIETGQLKKTLTGQKGFVTEIEFNSDCKRLLISSDDRTVRLWDVESGQLKKRITEHKRILLGGLFVKASFNPDGSTFITTSMDDSKPRLWEANGGELIKTMKVESTSVYSTGDVRGHSFSPDGRIVATSSFDNVINLWNGHSGKVEASLNLECDAYHFAFSPDGKLIATACRDGKSKIWDVSKAALIKTLSIIERRATTVAFTSDSQVLAACHPDIDKCNLWNVQSGELIATVPADDGHETMFSPDGKLFVTMDNKKKVRVWSTQNGNLISELTDARFPAVFSPDGKTLAAVGSDNRTVILWSVL